MGVTVPLNKKRQLDVQRDVEELVEDFTKEQQDKYRPIAIKIETELNEGLEDVLAEFRKEAAIYVTEVAPTRPDRNHEVLEITQGSIKKLYQEVYNFLSTLGSSNAGLKVTAIQAIKDGLDIVQKASVEQDMLLHKVILETLEQ